MLYEIIVSTKSNVDLLEFLAFYEEISDGLGVRFLEEYEQIIEKLKHSPNNNFNISSTVRRILFNKFHCGVFYCVNDVTKTVEIVAIKDMRVNPKKFPL